MFSMLQRAFVPARGNATMMGARQTRFFAAQVAHSRIPTEVDYYEVLGVAKDATPEQIKDAYREAAKKYHPDVIGNTDANAERFRSVMEAYGVLSVSQSRASYDLLRRKNPDAFREMAQEEFDRTFDVSKRDKAGQVRSEAAPGSYAETRMKELAEQRKQYNVNHIGYYRGGLPQKGRGDRRGTALGSPGIFHDPKIHNRLNFHHPDSKIINSEDAVKFKAWMTSDKFEFNLSRPSYPMYYDKDFSFSKDRRFFLSLILGLCGVLYIYHKVPYEMDRQTRWERMESITELPAHHFNNRGGVLIKKKFIGFEKYHKNQEELMNWYHMAYPNVIGEAK